MVAVIIIVIAATLTGLAWPLRHRGAAVRLAVVLSIGGVLCIMPLIAVIEPIGLRVLMVLACCAVLPPKLLEFHMNAHRWRERSLRDWLLYVPNPYVLVEWRRRLEPERSRSNALAWTARGLVEQALGAAVLYWAFARDFGPGGFWLEHGVKLVGAYLLAFDGMFVLATGVCRLAGFNVMDFSRHPALAPTPAHFWRRYNRDAGRFLYDHLFVPYGGPAMPIRGILFVFLANGLLHEYVALCLVGELRGFQVAFFAINGVAVALTFRLRPRGLLTVPAWLCTVTFFYFSTMLFFRTVHELVGWYG